MEKPTGATDFVHLGPALQPAANFEGHSDGPSATDRSAWSLMPSRRYSAPAMGTSTRPWPLPATYRNANSAAWARGLFFSPIGMRNPPIDMKPWVKFMDWAVFTGEPMGETMFAWYLRGNPVIPGMLKGGFLQGNPIISGILWCERTSAIHSLW